VEKTESNLVGLMLDQYEISSFIGKGGMGEVYKARDTALNRDVAIKVITSKLACEAALIKRFKREAHMAASLEHSNIIPIYTIGMQDTMHYIVMRYVNGETLRNLINCTGHLPLKRIVEILRQLAEALSYAHSKNIIHRDIKPSNIMIGHNDFVTLMDFGISKPSQCNSFDGSMDATCADILVGTFEYMAPEQFTGGPATSSSDIYALGVVVYEMLAGRVPFPGLTPVAVSHGHVYEQPPSLLNLNPQLSAETEQIVLQCLNKHPDQRYQNASEFYSALKATIMMDGATEPAWTDNLKLVLDDGQFYKIKPGVMKIGRTDENEIMVNDQGVSRYHAEIRHNGSSLEIIDLGSTNGTFVNGQQLTAHIPRQLSRDSKICLGMKICMIVKQDDA